MVARTLSYELDDGLVVELRRPTISWRRSVMSKYKGVDEETAGEGIIDAVLSQIESLKYNEDILLAPYDDHLSDKDIMDLCQKIFPNL